MRQVGDGAGSDWSLRQATFLIELEPHTSSTMSPPDPNTEEPASGSTDLVAPSGQVSPPRDDAGSIKRRAITYLVTTAGLMVALYALAYHSWDATSFAGRVLVAYLEAVAQVSAASLRLLGESVTTNDATVSGRFSYVVVVDCAALDVQALFVAAVLAFPSPWRTRLLGVVGGVAAIFAINITRLVGLYYAGASSLDLFHTLHQEVFVLAIVLLVCGLFLVWARWATLRSPLLNTPLIQTGALEKDP